MHFIKHFQARRGIWTNISWTVNTVQYLNAFSEQHTKSVLNLRDTSKYYLPHLSTLKLIQIQILLMRKLMLESFINLPKVTVSCFWHQSAYCNMGKLCHSYLFKICSFIHSFNKYFKSSCHKSSTAWVGLKEVDKQINAKHEVLHIQIEACVGEREKTGIRIEKVLTRQKEQHEQRPGHIKKCSMFWERQGVWHKVRGLCEEKWRPEHKRPCMICCRVWTPFYNSYFWSFQQGNNMVYTSEKLPESNRVCEGWVWGADWRQGEQSGVCHRRPDKKE